MILISPSASALLVDLTQNGIGIEVHGGAIRFRPVSAMTPALVERLQAHKVELLRFLDTAAAMAAIRQSVENLCKDPTWRPAWEKRLQAAQYADFAALQRVLNLILEQAEGHHRRHDWNAFASVCRYLHRVASGEEWDRAAANRIDDLWGIQA